VSGLIGTGRRAVAVGGGTGLPLVLRRLLDLGFETTAIVTMADDGGSSGVLRRQLGALPPGDVRNCLVAMAAEPEGLRARMFQYRFEMGEGLAGHALGNLVLAALAEESGSFVEAIEAASEFLRVRGRVLPSTLADVHLHGVDRDGAEVFGQALLAANPTPVERAYLEPSDPPAYEPALQALSEADVIVIGPGSLYTSIVPNFLVAGVADAVRASDAKRIYLCNVANLRGETLGLGAADHVEALVAHGLQGCIDVAVLNAPGGLACEDGSGPEHVDVCPEDVERIEALGIEVLTRDLADDAHAEKHDAAKLASVLEEVCA